MESELIGALGGNKAVAEALGIAPNVVANWQHDGRSIPWKRRHAIARIAAERGVPLPEGFWADTAA